MISYSAKQSKIYQELDENTRNRFFDFKQKFFLHNIDSLYYTIKLNVDDWNNDKRALNFKAKLMEYQEQAFNSNEPIRTFTSEEDYFNRREFLMFGVMASKIYRYDLQQMDKFACFICHKAPNPDTPEIIVQLRSQYLWLNNEKDCILNSLQDIKELLLHYDLYIKEVKENRIDYAYHTNYVQNPTKYFDYKNFNRMQHSRLKRGSFEFTFPNQWEMDTDYITLGRKKSNNIFFRMYDKTKEVIEMGYKQFFLKIWYLNKMINYFDFYCLEEAFLHPSTENYKYIDIARLKFYLEFGKDEKIKEDIKELIEAEPKDYESIVKLADVLTPKVTKIMNIEFETKRKFYSTLDSTINDLLTVRTEGVPDFAQRLFRIIDNKKLFHNYLTRNTSTGDGILRFINYKAKNRLGKPWKNKRDFPTSDFWKRLQSVSTDWKADNVELIREYQKNLSVELMKKRVSNGIVTFGLYNSKFDSDIFEDVADFLSLLNENDLERVNSYKEKKYLQLQGRLDINEVVEENRYAIIDLQTGEVISNRTELTQEYHENDDDSML